RRRQRPAAGRPQPGQLGVDAGSRPAAVGRPGERHDLLDRPRPQRRRRLSGVGRLAGTGWQRHRQLHLLRQRRPGGPHLPEPVMRALGLTVLLAASAAPLQAATCQASIEYDSGSHRGLRVTGTTGKQNVLINLSATTTVLSLDCNGDSDTDDAGEIDAVDQGQVDWLELQLGGADTITVNLAGNLTGGASQLLRVVLGPGTNVLHVASTAALNP